MMLCFFTVLFLSFNFSVVESLMCIFSLSFCLCSWTYIFQKSAICEPSESELCQPPRLRPQHHRESAIYERRRSKQCNAGTQWFSRTWRLLFLNLSQAMNVISVRCFSVLVTFITQLVIIKRYIFDYPIYCKTVVYSSGNIWEVKLCWFLQRGLHCSGVPQQVCFGWNKLHSVLFQTLYSEKSGKRMLTLMCIEMREKHILKDKTQADQVKHPHCFEDKNQAFRKKTPLQTKEYIE